MSALGHHDLSNIEMLGSLTTEHRRDFEMSCRWRRFTPNEQIIDQRDESREVYFITRGRVRVVSFTLSGREVALEDLHAGAYFGELAALDGHPRSTSVMALDGHPRSTSVMALEESDIGKMAPERFLKVLQQYPDVALKVMINFAKIIRISTDRIVDLSTLGANNRVHGEVLRQALAMEPENNIATIRPIPVHSDMASRASTTRETVARVMNDLARRGIVKREKDCLIVCDVDELQAIVETVRG